MPLEMSESELYRGADLALEGLQSLFRSACSGLARRCSREGKLNSALLDEYQLPCYELAFVSAELMAASTAVEQARMGTQPLDKTLSLQYLAESVLAIRSRLEPLLSEFELEEDAVDSVFMNPTIRKFVQYQNEPRMLNETGQEILLQHQNIGFVQLDEDKAMMQEAFQRMAMDTVAPRAEEIHRQDLTVPEDVLQPLRDMGVFGLSIPERFGGTAPNEGEDNLAMIVVTEA
ncbi:MAG: acyl-CoA dehydrogenase family protein, partial [Pseudomonadales bacterium]